MKEKKESLSRDLIFEKDLTDFEKVKFQKVELTGKFDHDKEVFVGIRSLQRASKNSPVTSSQTGLKLHFNM